MDNFLRFCSIESIIIAFIKLALIGYLTPGTVVFIIISGLLIFESSFDLDCASAIGWLHDVVECTTITGKSAFDTTVKTTTLDGCVLLIYHFLNN